MKAALKEAVAQIKAAGFSHIKVELEGDIGRDGERDCHFCEGSGREDCNNCGGSGYVSLQDDNGNDYEPECASCDGEGYIDCEDCEGMGTMGTYMDEDVCDEFMKNWVRSNYPEARRRLTYGRFYEDGSVDSEFTFTVPIENVEDVPIWMQAFQALAEEAGDGNIEVSGAGLHVAILPEESNGIYPVEPHTLPQDKVNNFQREVTKLLPALFFLGSSNHRSRDLGYRHPKIDWDKYSAINLSPSGHDNSCFEYRVFETCYDNPEAFFDYVKVIANTLKFYVDPSLRVKTLGKKFGFNDGDECARFYNTPEQLRILNATVKHIKPKDKTFKKLKEERGVRYTIKSLAEKEKVRLQQIREDYREYRRRFLEANSRELSLEELQSIDWLMVEHNLTRREAEEQVRGSRIGGRLIPLSEFISRNVYTPNYEESVNV